MTAVLALAAVVLIAAGTPRQAALLFGDAVGPVTAKRLRTTGWVVLACSLAVILMGPDAARRSIAWIGAVGIEAIAVALLVSAGVAPRAGHPRRSAPRMRPPQDGASDRPMMR